MEKMFGSMMGGGIGGSGGKAGKKKGGSRRKKGGNGGMPSMNQMNKMYEDLLKETLKDFEDNFGEKEEESD